MKEIGDSFSCFVSTFKLEKTVSAIKDYSHNAVTQFSDESVDFIFMDGDRSYHSVVNDLTAWLPKLKAGGIIAGDALDWQSVFSVVRDFTVANDIEYTVYNTIWYFQKTKDVYLKPKARVFVENKGGVQKKYTVNDISGKINKAWELYIYGASASGSLAYSIARKTEFKVCAFVETNPEKPEFEGLFVISFSEFCLRNLSQVIIASAGFQDEIERMISGKIRDIEIIKLYS